MMAHRTGSKQLLRDLNKNIVLNLIAHGKSISRSELARRSGLPGATITHIVNEFISAGLINEVTEGTSGNGRPPLFLQLNAEAGYVIGVVIDVKLQEQRAQIVVCDLSCTIIHSYEKVIGEDWTPYKVVESIAEGIKQCAQEANVPLKRVLGVGVGLAGLIDSHRGICRYSPFFKWKNIELGPALEFLLHIPVRIDNDVNTLTVAERQFGVGRDMTNFLMVVVGRGVGLGVVVGGEIYRGARGGAGEFGHIKVDTREQAPLCHCGRRGCLEAFVSEYALVRAATGIDEESQTDALLQQLITRADAGDAAALKIFTDAGNILGSSLAHLIHLFDPVCIMLGRLPGKNLLLDPMKAAIACSPSLSQREEDPVQMIQSIEDSNTQWLRGAASLIVRELFQPPLYDSQPRILIDDILARTGRTPTRKRR
ncbi:xylose repressor protein [Dictyobacter alpinus]|uniref:Xylose repressor protein n=1 Tax=Dictyobacter alpinus TaxID=2014873 RepID=A0A402BE26_9CHLR|nr:ROK family transcriptional regulator [Dictyobacter alpinus]GCE29579.1 xylose repressor protein [Dictyobacter alpinus]